MKAPDPHFVALIDKIKAKRQEAPKEPIESKEETPKVMTFPEAFKYLGRVLAGGK